MSVEPHDETTHAKPKSDKRKGLLAGRFRPGPLVEHDAFRTAHEAVDEADGSKVVVHFLSERFGANRTMRRETVARLLDRVGHGNQFVSPIVEAGIENDRVFVVEPRASGVTLRSVLRGRARARKPLDARELLPVIARIRAALEALPPDFIAGRISPRTVFIDPEGLRLSECFILSSLDRAALVSLFEEDESIRLSYAPECAKGRITRAADLFAVGALVHEALTFAPISGDVVVALGPLERDVRALLAPTPDARPDLDLLIERLASLSGMIIPDLDAQPFELDPATRAARLAAFDEATDVELLDTDEDVDDDDEDDISPIREEDKTRQLAFPTAGPVIDDLAMNAGDRRLPAPSIVIESSADPIAAPRASAPKAPPPARKPRPQGRTPDASLPAPKSDEAVRPPKSEPPAPLVPTIRLTSDAKPQLEHPPSVEISLAPMPTRPDTTDRIPGRKRAGEITLQLRALDDTGPRPAAPAVRDERARGLRLVLIAMIIAGVLLAFMLAFAIAKKQSDEARRREMIEQRLREIREE